MNRMRKLLTAALACVMIFSMTVTAAAADDAAGCIRKIINYYKHHQMEAETDIDCLIEALAETEPALAESWEQIISYWDWINTEMDMSAQALPDGLPEDNSLCIVVLGYALKSDGAMAKELIGRLEVALAAAEKYPNAYIACTGGGTARWNKTTTEAERMAQWLMENGIAEDRIIIENHSFSTVANAQNTTEILNADYPEVQHLALVTSDYHLGWGCLLFAAESILSVSGSDVPARDIVGYASFTTSEPATTIALQANELGSLAGVNVEHMKKPKLSELEYITVDGETVCNTGQELALTVTAHYSTGLSRNVTARSKYSGFDLAKAGMQTVKVSYTEKGVTEWTAIDIEFLAVETESIPQTEPVAVIEETAAPETVPETQPAPAETEPQNDDNPMVFVFVTAAAAALVLFLLKRRKSA